MESVENKKIKSFLITNFLFFIFAIVLSVYLLSNEFGDLELLRHSLNTIKLYKVNYSLNLLLIVSLGVIIISLIIGFFKNIFILIGKIFVSFLFFYIFDWIFADNSSSSFKDNSQINETALVLIFIVISIYLLYIGYQYLSTVNLVSKLFLIVILPSFIIFLHGKFSNPHKQSISNVYKKPESRIITHFQLHGYPHKPGDILYRSEKYISFPEQNQYVLKHGIFSKILVARLLNMPLNILKNDCNLNYEKMGLDYKKAYQIKERNPNYFLKVYNRLLSEVDSVARKSITKDPMKDLCLLHTGWCMWESYLISTGDLLTANKYGRDVYRFTPKISSSPFTFDTGNYCGETKNAVLLWIRPEDYKIEKIR